MSTLAESWTRIMAWTQANAPESAHASPPASPEQVGRLRSRLGLPLPADLEAWLSVADGAEIKVWSKSPEEAWQLFGAREIAEDRAQLGAICAELVAEYGPSAGEGRAVGPARPLAWSSAWIPVATNGAGARLCLDTDPAPGGAVGQVIVYHGSSPLREVICPSLSALLAGYADGLARGEYENEPFVGPVPRAE